MSFKGKTYSKKGSAKSGNPFDRMMKEQCNKPVAAKSAGIVGKWGATSFTSLRGSGDNPNPGVPKVKKFFKSRTDPSDSSVDATSDQSSESPIVTVASAKIISVPEKPKQPAGKKFFRARNREIDPTITESSEQILPPEPKSRARPSRPAQRSSDMSRSPIQRSPTHRSSVERSPIHISPPTSLPPSSPSHMPAPKTSMKPLPVPQRRVRQPKVPEFKENPMDKASRLLALMDSQSKENKPSEQAQVAKSVKVQKPAKVAPQESQRPNPGPTKVSLPPKFPNFLPKITESQENKAQIDNNLFNSVVVDKRKKNAESLMQTLEASKPTKREPIKPVRETKAAQKRKVEEPEVLPPIKLKISLNKSPYVADQYSVVNRPEYDDSMSESSVGSEQPSTVPDSDTASDKTDLSNGFGSNRGYNHSSGYSASASDSESVLSRQTQAKAKLKGRVEKAAEPSIVEQSDLELLDGDFVVDYSETESVENFLEMIPGPRTRSSSPIPATRSPSPVVEPPPKKVARRASPEIVPPVVKKPGRKPGPGKDAFIAGQVETGSVVLDPPPVPPVKPLPTLQRKTKKTGPIKEVFEIAVNLAPVKKGRKAAIVAEETEEILPKRGSRRQSPVVPEKVEDIVPKSILTSHNDEIFNSGDDTEPEVGGSDADYMPVKGRKKSPDLQLDQGQLKKTQRKQNSRTKKESKKPPVKKQVKDPPPQPVESPPPAVILECIPNHSEENSNDSDFSLNSVDKFSLGKPSKKQQYGAMSTTPEPVSKEPSPDFEITFSPRGKTPTSPALEVKKSRKAFDTAPLVVSPVITSSINDMAVHDDPPTRPQSPDFEENFPERITSIQTKAVKKTASYMKANEPILKPESPDFEENFPQRISSVQEAKKLNSYKRKNEPSWTVESLNFEDNFPQRITMPSKETKKPVTYKRTNEPILRAESPDFGMDFPARITSVPSKEAKKPATYKRSIFKSRAKPVEEPQPVPPPVAMSSPRSPEPPRVPPINLPHVNPTPPDSTSLSDFDSLEMDFPARKVEAKPKKQFFKSRNKSPCESSSSQEISESEKQIPVKVSRSVNRIPPLTSDYDSSQLTPSLRSPSPEFNIEYPARIAAPAKEVLPVVKPMKRSIFKSKAKSNQENTAPPKKALSLYKHKMGWGGDKDELKRLEAVKETQRVAALAAEKPAIDSYDDSEFDSEPLTSESDMSFAPSKLTRVATYPTNNTGLDDDGDLVTQVKCPKSYKEYFTVIKNVKKAHEMNDLGEYQEFNDDVEYISDGMKPRNSTAARCLAAISLAVKCMKPNFRMHLRAHGEVSKFFVELKDAPTNPSLALCTSTILFVLSQDRLNMDMDRDSLELMLNLLDTDCNIKDALEGSGLDKRELSKNKQKVIDICTEMQSKGHAGTLNLDKISADHLAMETLLSMTSKRAGEWFKEELRELGGLGHLARTLTDCVSYLTVKDIKTWTEGLGEKLKKANRILRVLENVSHENEENCGYLIEYGRTLEVQEEEFLEVLQKLFKLLDEEVQLNPTNDYADKETIGVILRDTLFSVIRVHINLVHDYRMKAYGSLYVGQKQGCMARVLRILFIMPFWFCPLGKRFEALVLALTLMINMVEHCDENRQSLMDSMAAQKDSDFCVKEEPRMAVEDLVQLFIDRDTLAKMSEEKTDNILDDVDEEVQEIDPREDAAKKNDKPTLDETVQKLIGKAGNHMESTLIASYVGLVMGYLIKNSEDYEQRIREYLPTRDFKEVVYVLDKLHNFMKMTSIGTVASSKGIKATEKIIKHMEKIDAEPESEEEREDTVDFSLFDVSRDDTTLIDNTQNYASTSYSMDDWGKF